MTDRNPWLHRAAVAAVALILGGASLAAGATAAPVADVGVSRMVGQLLMGRLVGPTPSPGLLSRIRRGELGGIILFPDNFTSDASLRSLTRALQAAAASGGNPPLLIATDQEGGTVARLPNGPPGRSARELGATGDPGVVRRAGRATGAYLRARGIGVDLAPVLDVPHSASNFLGSRAFGVDPAVVARVGPAFVQGLQTARVAATAKHFPGLGAAHGNTDLASISINSSREDLERRLSPFRAAIRYDTKLVMISNASYPALDPSGVPAPLSRAIVTGLLHQRLGFRGVVITDAFTTPAPAQQMAAESRAIEAGVDVILYADGEDSSRFAFTTLREAAVRGKLDPERLAAAYGRVLTLKEVGGSTLTQAFGGVVVPRSPDRAWITRQAQVDVAYPVTSGARRPPGDPTPFPSHRCAISSPISSPRPSTTSWPRPGGCATGVSGRGSSPTLPRSSSR